MAGMLEGKIAAVTGAGGGIGGRLRSQWRAPAPGC